MKRIAFLSAVVLSFVWTPAKAQVPAGPSSQRDHRIAEVESQIATTQGEIDRIKGMPVEFAGVLTLMGTENTIRTPTKEEAAKRVSERTKTMGAELAEARRELESVQARKKEVPVEFLRLAEAMEYVASEKVALLEREVADSKEDSVYLGIDAPSPGQRQALIDRKLALLDKTAGFLKKEKKLLSGQDPRPA